MPDDPLPPLEPSVSPGGPVAPGSGLPSPTAAGLASLFSLPGGVVFYWLDRKDAFVRFYAVQAIVLGCILTFASLSYRLGYYIFDPVPLIGWLIVGALKLVWMVFILAWLVVWTVSTVCAFLGKRWQLPFLAPLLKRYASREP